MEFVGSGVGGVMGTLTLFLPHASFNGRNSFLHFPRFIPNNFSFSLSFNPRSPFSMASSSSSTTDSTPQIISSGDVDNNEIDISQLIRAHQDKAARLSPAEEIRTLLDQSVRGALSTISRNIEGYPSGSFVDFACDADGTPILAVSSLAEHAKNLATNPKCSLLVAKDHEDRASLVVTLHGDAVSVSEDNIPAVRAAYLAKHPNAFWVDFGDFQFVYIKPKVIRYVSGVATASLGTGELSDEEYKAAKVDPIAQFSKPVTSHMNRDHTEDTKAIVRHWTSIPVDSAIMLDLDSLGINVKASYQGNSFKLRVPFPRRAENRKDVKTLVVEMLQAANPQA